jgi:hypothetical protein
MITDSQTNTVYFSNLISADFKAEFNELNGIIETAGYKTKLLVETYDYYCRDYMPAQVLKVILYNLCFALRPISNRKNTAALQIRYWRS